MDLVCDSDLVCEADSEIEPDELGPGVADTEPVCDPVGGEVLDVLCVPDCVCDEIDDEDRDLVPEIV